MPKQTKPTTAAPNAAAPRTDLPVAVQMYTLRTLQQPVDEIFAEISAIGYDGVELAGNYGLAAADLRSRLDAHGLRTASAHISLTDMEKDLPSIIRFNKILGNDTLIVPWLPVELRGATAESWRTLGTRLATLGRRCGYAGMRLLYHNHDFEMVTIDGRLAIDWLMDEASKEGVGFEIDLAWVTVGGQQPTEILARYAGRCPRVHVKDLGDDPEERGFADVGHGKLDWAAILPAAKAAGAEWLVVEHDQPREPLTSIRRSYEFLSGQ